MESVFEGRDCSDDGTENFVSAGHFLGLSGFKERDVELLGERAPHHIRLSRFAQFHEQRGNHGIVEIGRCLLAVEDFEDELDCLDRLRDEALYESLS